jgi:hypothetical protein
MLGGVDKDPATAHQPLRAREFLLQNMEQFLFQTRTEV